jgi:hypothetical protein
MTFNVDDPSTWWLKYPAIAHDVGFRNDRSTAVVGGLLPYRPDVLGVIDIVELPKNCSGSELARALWEIDRKYNNDATIFADLSNNQAYAEPLFDMFGNRANGVHIGPHGDGTKFDRQHVRNSTITTYHLGRSELFERLLSDFRSNQIRFSNSAMARRLYEQLTLLQVEQKDGRKFYRCPSSKHDDLAISLAILNFMIRHPHWELWKGLIDRQHKPRMQVKSHGWGAFV